MVHVYRERLSIIQSAVAVVTTLSFAEEKYLFWENYFITLIYERNYSVNGGISV
jgi:hypothetical protein